MGKLSSSAKLAASETTFGPAKVTRQDFVQFTITTTLEFLAILAKYKAAAQANTFLFTSWQSRF